MTQTIPTTQTFLMKVNKKVLMYDTNYTHYTNILDESQ